MHLLPDALQVVHGRRVGVGRSAKMKKRLRAVRLGRELVVERKAKFLRELTDGRVALVNQFPAVLGNLPFREVAPTRPATPAESRIGLVNRGVDARLLEPIRTRQPGEARADHDHARGGAAGLAGDERRRHRRGGRRQRNTPDKITPRRRAHGPLVEHSIDFDATNRSL